MSDDADESDVIAIAAGVRRDAGEPPAPDDAAATPAPMPRQYE